MSSCSSETNKKSCTKKYEELFAEIPDYKLGDIPDELYDKDFKLARCVIVKRALVAGYEDPQVVDCLCDLLADIRHFCDKMGCGFAELDRMAYRHYIEERNK